MDKDKDKSCSEKEKKKKQVDAVEEAQLVAVPGANLPPAVLNEILQYLQTRHALLLQGCGHPLSTYVEEMLASTRHLLLYIPKVLEKYHLARRFFATHLKPFEKIPINAEAFSTLDLSIDYISPISINFLRGIQRTFPNLEHLLIDTVIDNDSGNALVQVLPIWKNLRTLSAFRLSSNISKKVKQNLMNAICQCHKVSRLGITDFDTNWFKFMNWSNYIGFAYESNEDISSQVVQNLTTNIKCLWTGIDALSPESVENWATVNRRVIEKLHMVHLGNIHDIFNGDRGYVDVSSFKSLHVLRVQFACWASNLEVANAYEYQTLDPQIFNTMVGLGTLYKLELICFKMAIQATLQFGLVSLPRVTHLKLTRFYGRDAGDFDGVGFCTIFSQLFPQLKELSLVVANQADGEAIEQCYRQFFTHLKKFEFTRFVPVRSDSYIGYLEFYPERSSRH